MTTPCVSSGNWRAARWGASLGCTRTPAHVLTPHSRPRLCLCGTGSLWDPSITVETLEAHQLRLSFTPWNESTKYQILLDSFLPAENRSCFRHVVDLDVVTALSAALLTPQLGSEPPLQASRPRRSGCAGGRDLGCRPPFPCVTGVWLVCSCSDS